MSCSLCQFTSPNIPTVKKKTDSKQKHLEEMCAQVFCRIQHALRYCAGVDFSIVLDPL